MLDVLFKTKLSKVNTNFNANEIMAGIVYDKSGERFDKILFTISNDCAKDVFNDSIYSLNDKNGDFYVSDVVSLAEPIKYFFNKFSLNLAEMYLVYKRFINNDRFIKANLSYFDMIEVEVGYDDKMSIIENPWFSNSEKQKLYYSLMNIINFYSKEFKNEIRK